MKKDKILSDINICIDFAYTFPFEGNWTIGSQQSAISNQ